MEMGTLQDTAGVNPLKTKTFTGKLQSSAEGMRPSKRIRLQIFNGVL